MFPGERNLLYSCFFRSSMAKLPRHLRPSLPARPMASRLFSSPSLKNHNFISPSSLSGLFLYPRKDAGVVRTFMSSSHDDKAFEGMDVAAADSCEQQTKRPLKTIATRSGDVYIPHGVSVPALDKDTLWEFQPKNLGEGDLLTGGDLYATI